jgi:hypothetical protein
MRITIDVENPEQLKDALDSIYFNAVNGMTQDQSVTVTGPSCVDAGGTLVTGLTTEDRLDIARNQIERYESVLAGQREENATLAKEVNTVRGTLRTVTQERDAAQKVRAVFGEKMDFLQKTLEAFNAPGEPGAPSTTIYFWKHSRAAGGDYAASGIGPGR